MRTRIGRAGWMISLIMTCHLCAGLEGDSSWHVAYQLPRRSWRVMHLDADGGGDPDFVLRPATLTSVHFSDRLHGWAAGEGGTLVQTLDGGRNWKSSIVDPKANLYAVRFSDPLHGWAAGEIRWGRAVIFHTQDGGSHWKASTVPQGSRNSGVTGLSFVNEKHGWAAGVGRRDDGETVGIVWRIGSTPDQWNLQFTQKSEDGFVGISFVDEDYGWVIATDRVFHTEDGGRTWKEQYRPDKQTDPFFMGLEFVSRTEGWIVGGMYSGHALHTVDGGRTWNPVPLPQKEQLPAGTKKLFVSSVGFTDSKHGWIGAADGLVLSTKDGGKCWAAEQTGQSGAIRGVANARGTTFLVTTDGSILNRRDTN